VNSLKFTWIIGLICSFLTLSSLHDYSYQDDFVTLSSDQLEKPDLSNEEEKEWIFSYKQQPILKMKGSDLSLPFYDFPLIDPVKLEKAAEQLDQAIRRDAVNAALDDHGQIISEQAGVELNKRAFFDQFQLSFYEKGVSNLEVPVRTVYPRVDSELLESIRTKMVGHYVTYFNSGNKQRSNNILLAAQAINNYVVFPGEVFSFNKTVGKRTKAKGYQIAPIIVRGEMSEDIGGGICQVSSTLFNAVDRSGLKILERFSHSKRVPYVPPGRDATVSWYGPDFSFKNTYNQPILLRTKVTSGMVIVFVFSSEDINVKKNQVPSADAKLPPETELKSVHNNRLP
jgi:vancomycin resistance protein YoaR